MNLEFNLLHTVLYSDTTQMLSVEDYSIEKSALQKGTLIVQHLREELPHFTSVLAGFFLAQQSHDSHITHYLPVMAVALTC